MRRPSLPAIATFIAVAGSVLFVFWQLHPSLIFSSTTDTGGDTGAHVATAYFLGHNLLPHGHLTGWDPGWYDGFPLYTYYFLLPDLFAAIGGHIFNFNVAFKLATVLGSLTLPVAVWAFAKLAGMKGPRPAALAAFSLPFLFDQTWSIYGGNIYSTMAGEYAYSLSISFALVFLGLFSRGMRTGKGRIWTSLALGACILAHIVPAMFAIIGAIIIYLIAGAGYRRLWWGLSTGVVGLLLVAFWLVPFGLLGSYTTTMGWQNVTTWRAIFFPGADIWACILAAVGLLLCTWRQERTVAALMCLGIVMLVGTIFDPTHELYNVRLLPLYWLCVYLIAGYAVAEIGIVIARAASWRPSSGEPFPISWLGNLLPGAWATPGGVQMAGAGSVPTSVAFGEWANQVAPSVDLFSSFDSPAAPSTSQFGTVTLPATEVPTVEEDGSASPAAVNGLATSTLDAVPGAVTAGDTLLQGTEPETVAEPATNGATNGNGHSGLNGGDSNGNGNGSGRFGIFDAPPKTKKRNPGAIFVPLLALFITVAIVLPPLLPNTFSFLSPGASSEPGWVDWDLSGYQTKTSWPEFNSLISLMSSAGSQYGCGRVMWEYNDSEGRFGTPMALMDFPMFTNGCINTQEGLLFESSATTPYHFLDQSELSTAPSDAVNGLDYGPSGSPNVALGVEHLQLMGVKYFLAETPTVTEQADADPNLVLIKRDGPWPNSTDPQNPNTTWSLYLVKDAPTVSALTNQPENLVGVAQGQNTWLPVAQTWYLNPARWATEMVANGPANWPKVTATSATTAPTGKALPKVSVTDVSMSDSQISFHVSKVGVPVLVKVSYFPAWHASGAEGPYRAEPDLMVVVPTSKNVTLTYGSTPQGDLGDGLTLVGCIGLVVFAFIRRREASNWDGANDQGASVA